MTVISRHQEMMNEEIASGASFRFDMAEAAQGSFEETMKSGPMMAVKRAVDSFMDTSANIDPNEANEKFGLTGTDAAFKPDETVSLDRAKSVSDDFYFRRLNSLVKETVNAESPIMGNVTQFAASLAAGFTDPVMLAANMGGAAIIGATGKALINSKRAFDTVSKASPAAGRMLLGAYSEGVKRSLTAVVAREGLENFVGGVIEEGVIRGFDVGEERLAVKTDWTDSMLNITAGTILGTALGTGISKDGRQAIMSKFGRMYGDDAPMRIKQELEMSDIESRLGIEKSHFESKLYDHDTYNPKPWHGESNYKFDPSNQEVPGKVYISVAEDGTAYRPQILGRGTVLHDNINLAYNKGARVMEIDTANLRIIGPRDLVDAKGRPTIVATQLRDTLAEDVVKRTDTTMLNRALRALDQVDDALDDVDVTDLNRNQLISAIKERLDGKNIDEMLDIMDDLGVKNQIAYDPIRSVNAVIEKHNWNGYQFTGKKSDGSGAYKGIYVAEKFQKKLSKSAELQTPVPSEGDMIKHKFQLEQMHKEYADWMGTKARSLKQTAGQAAGAPKATVDETVSPPKNEIQETLTATVEKKSALAQVDAELDARIAASEGTSAPSKGTLRVYHGGSPEGMDMPLWTTTSLADAQGWASRGKGMKVWYVDIPEAHPEFINFKGNMDTIGDIPPSSRRELPKDLANTRKELVQKTGTVDPEIEQLKALKKLSDDIKAGKDVTTMAAEFRKQLDEYDTCMIGA